MKRAVCAVLLVAGLEGAAQQDIQTGGPIPDKRGFNNRVNDPKAVAEVTVVVRRVAGNVYVIAGAGGNIVVQAGDGGLLLVDNNFSVFHRQIMAALRRISDQPIRIVVNTHAHFDHNQNNAVMARDGALVFSHPNTRLALVRENPSGPPEAFPVVAAAQPITFHFNGEEVSYIPLKPAHTNGDIAVYFHGSDVWAFGDVFTTGYPSIAVPVGGTVENFVDNYNRALDMTTPSTSFVPGHGQLSRRGDLIALRDAISVVHTRFREMVAKRMTLEQIRAARPSKEFDARFAPESFAPNEMMDSHRWYEQMFNEATAHGHTP